MSEFDNVINNDNLSDQIELNKDKVSIGLDEGEGKNETLEKSVLNDIKKLQFKHSITPSGFVEVNFSVPSKAKRYIERELTGKYVVHQDNQRKNIFIFKSKTFNILND